ncbi:MAG: transcription-repair coupling factor [Bacteroidota bacterium]|nr:transcription-repair coupling factor [Bacteroidota bacterium]
MQKLLSKINQIKKVNKLLAVITGDNGTNPISISSLPGAAKSFFVRQLFEKEERIVILLSDIKAVQEFIVELDALGLSKHVIEIISFNQEVLQEKLTTLTAIKTFILVSTYELLNCLLPDSSKLTGSTTTISISGDYTYDLLVEKLVESNYQKEKYVESPGDYSQRGSIIDFWSYSEKNPVRLEFDGDFLESIRFFDPDSQRSVEKTDKITLAEQIISDGSEQSKTSIFSYLTGAVVFAGMKELKELNDKQNDTFKADEVQEAVNYDLEDEFPEPDSLEEETANNAKNDEYYLTILNNSNVRWVVEDIGRVGSAIEELGLGSTPSINANYKMLDLTIRDYAAKGYTVFITAENDIQNGRLRELFSELNDELADMLDTGIIRLSTLTIKSGFVSPEDKFVLLTDYEIFNKPFRTKVIKKKGVKSKAKNLTAIKKGDYVVHEDYGISKYAGLETIKIGDVNQESMKLIFAEGGIVYVNVNYIHLIKKFSSNETLTPALSTLGTNRWEKTKQKAKSKIKEAAKDLIQLYAKRKAAKGFAFNPDTIWQTELEASFIYEDTPDQEKVTREVKEDMEATSPMDRLVCGDVGFGKTEIAVRAAFKAVQDGKQAAVLVPTTILAEQHYNTFSDRLSQFPVKIEVLSRFRNKKNQTEIIKKLSEGEIDVIIGTHRLISNDIKFKDLGVLIIDEEHRFGVKAKDKLKSFKVNVDTLTLTATPIPRTLNFSLLGARDLSLITTPPPNRQPIYTNVSVFDVFKIKEWILSELRRNGQVFFVHDRIHSIYNLVAYMKKYMPNLRIAVAHGQMKPEELEKVIHGFLNKDFDVLLSTKIIESGIDIPNANTIIINRADRFGLAELHQLRGRVGRSNRQAYAYLIVPSLSSITKKALRRLQAIEDFSEIGSGFNISMRDLEIRGAGNLLGTEQSGFINDVGFDLYIKLINQAVDELKYSEFKEIFQNLPKPKDRAETVIDAFFELGISENYMPDQMDRLNFYTALYAAETLEDIEEIKDEIHDRFGDLPIITRRLIASAKLRLHSAYALFDRIIIQRKEISILLPKPDKEEFYQFRFLELMRYIGDNYKNMQLVQSKVSIKLVVKNMYDKPESIFEFLIRFAREVTKLYNNEVPSRMMVIE